MFDRNRFDDVLKQYKRDFIALRWGDEKYKWEAIKWFQDNWDVDASDFTEMLKRALGKTFNLLTSAGTFPMGTILMFAESKPEEVRSMFINLFDETKDVYDRMNAFKEKSVSLIKGYEGKYSSHYQNENAISTYLWLRYPNKYYIYKFGEVKAVASELKADCTIKKGDYSNNLHNFFSLYNELNAVLKEDKELAALFKSQLTDSCYPDPELKTLTFDVGFYIYKIYSHKDETAPVPEMASDTSQNTEQSSDDEYPRYWWLNANPKIWSFSDIAVGEVQKYTLYTENGNKRRVFQNFIDAKDGDIVIGYESNPVKQVVAIGCIDTKQDGEKLYIKKTESLTSPIDCTVLNNCHELENMEYFQNPHGTLFKLTKGEYDFIIDLIREDNPAASEKSIEPYTKDDFLEEIYMSEQRYDRLKTLLLDKKNIILQGAPGVGKTFAAKRLAMSVMGEMDESRIESIQFHQNYSYEDFIMGYKPVEDGFELKYGVFYRFCQKADNQPDKDFFFIIDEINRGNMSKIFGELLMLIEKGYRGKRITLAYNGLSFAVPENIYIIGMMNTADRSLAMIDYALRRRFSFFDFEPAFDSEGFIQHQKSLKSDTLDKLIVKIQDLNEEISSDKSLGKGFRIGHSYFCDREVCTDKWLLSIVDYDILPMLSEYWFDDDNKLQKWEKILHGVFQ